MNVDESAEVARRAALAGGDAIRRAPSVRDFREKASGDYVTGTDVAAERAIVEVLRDARPDVPVLTEESGGTPSEGLIWAVDPLDGTTNFIHGFPAVGVSVALLDDGQPVASCVHAPFFGETYVAARGAGAWRDRERITVSERSPDRAVVATGFPFRRRSLLERYLRTFEAALRSFEDLRRPGAAALDLAWTASGVFDGFFELGLSTWDVAAGVLVVEESGGISSDWEGGASHVATGDILAGNAPVHGELLRIAAAGRSAEDRPTRRS